MVEIVCSPPKQLVILECTQYPSIEALSNTIATIIRVGRPLVLKWAEGVTFSYSFLPPTTDGLMKELLEGRVYWTDVVFALMPEYESSIKVGTLDIPVIDVTPNPILREAAKWMKAGAQGSIAP
ncbi:MAG: hypothetical protein OEW95_08585 [Candidatus Bathyarchaeota archaeon]|nr:hypothetical protein [Candidatus Bathyarchaeota archaeon]MDH5712534.1 hypothetical protein [Candidatus Bathyarchaeota archaeon]